MLISAVCVVAEVAVETGFNVPIVEAIFVSSFNVDVVDLAICFIVVGDIENGFTETGTCVGVFDGIVVDLMVVEIVNGTVWDVFVVEVGIVFDVLEELSITFSVVVVVAEADVLIDVFPVLDIVESTFTVDFDVFEEVVGPKLTAENTLFPVDIVDCAWVLLVEIDVEDVVDIESLVIRVGKTVVVEDLDFISSVNSVVAGMYAFLQIRTTVIQLVE